MRCTLCYNFFNTTSLDIGFLQYAHQVDISRYLTEAIVLELFVCLRCSSSPQAFWLFVNFMSNTAAKQGIMQICEVLHDT